jgi:hypothetical protein
VIVIDPVAVSKKCYDLMRSSVILDCMSFLCWATSLLGPVNRNLSS